MFETLIGSIAVRFLFASFITISIANGAFATPLSREWAKEAERCSGTPDKEGDAACGNAEIYWDKLVAAACKYRGHPHSFDPNGWVCRSK
jgi:hypothetical protein